MAIVTKGVFTDIDDMLMEPLTEATDNTSVHSYCALAAQAKHLQASYITFTERKKGKY